ncbi:uncharacterized protein LOC100828893 [Brachypodium distachyon]|uniref:Uncharacterized protein n=1 Tax=Brachypodium distachyon TaxID=15368 RepID=A0A0Q3R241_BRADI|nr:uncharacterized protein LOC100828893 [Brachypodium distachyon]KQK07530.1 hypothetical protein BRADI_2g36053v3 [Brachypodium distachyon]|eukprot:XP_003568944.1 uncharacterized protein LOC100828893 [Brachypodium distachyon]
MAKRATQYVVVDAFAGEAFKGNPAAVCLLEDEDVHGADERWLQSVAAEFNAPMTAFLSRTLNASSAAPAPPRFHIRWFSPATEVALCGHATLASAHFLFTAVLVPAPEEDMMAEFVTKSGMTLAAKKVPAPVPEKKTKAFIELDFPICEVLVDCTASAGHELPSSLFLNDGLKVASVHRTSITDDFIVELSSGKEVVHVLPNVEQMKKCAGRAVIVTGQAPPGSAFDFVSRVFGPKLGVDEDLVCGSAHCALAPYWAGKLGKQKLTAFQVSKRNGTLYLELDDANRRVKIQGEAVTVMSGALLA